MNLCDKTSAPAVLSPVYGPVRSWRFGRSLGIDLLLHRSTCNFRCVYCQLGKIECPTDHQAVYVETRRVVHDLARVNWDEVDVVTFSGSGEPTLALNIGEVAEAVARIAPGKPRILLTNAAWLHDRATRLRLREFDVVECKLDAASDRRFRAVNRPVEGVTLERIVRGIREMRHEPTFQGRLHLQIMVLPGAEKEGADFAALVNSVNPDEIHLNLPRRETPRVWEPESRGNHSRRTKPHGKGTANGNLDQIRLEKLADQIKCLSPRPIPMVIAPV